MENKDWPKETNFWSFNQLKSPLESKADVNQSHSYHSLKAENQRFFSGNVLKRAAGVTVRVKIMRTYYIYSVGLHFLLLESTGLVRCPLEM